MQWYFSLGNAIHEETNCALASHTVARYCRHRLHISSMGFRLHFLPVCPIRSSEEAAQSSVANEVSDDTRYVVSLNRSKTKVGMYLLALEFDGGEWSGQ
jgi:hypothetical protein